MATDFSWADDPTSVLYEAACVTLIPNVDRAQVLSAFGGSARRKVVARVDAGKYAAIALVAAENGVVGVEFNGDAGTNGKVLRALSVGRRAASAHWNVNALTVLSFARDGNMIGAVEAGPELELGSGELDEVLAGLPFGLDNYRSSMLAAITRFTGVHVSEQQAEAIETLHVVRPPVDFAADPLKPEFVRGRVSRGTGGNDTLTQAIIYADENSQRHLAFWAAEQALTAMGLVNEPAVVKALAAPHRVDATSAQLDALMTDAEAAYKKRERIRDFGPFTDEDRWLARRLNALRALQWAMLAPDSVQAAAESLFYASTAFAPDKQEFYKGAARFLAER